MKWAARGTERSLLVVHAHPDDESITTGGTLAGAAASGVAVTLVTCTLGEQGEIIPPDLAGLAAEFADQLGGYRHTELAAACDALGVTDHRYLGGIGAYRDSGMAGSASAARPTAFIRARVGGVDHERAITDLLAVIDDVRPQVMISYDADGGYGHPDHIAAHEVARHAAAKSPQVRRFFAIVRPEPAVRQALDGFPVPAGYAAPVPADLGFLVDPAGVGVQIDVTGALDRHRAALAAHATQLELLDVGFALSNRIAQPILPIEYFALLDGEALDGPVGGDLFAGLTT